MLGSKVCCQHLQYSSLQHNTTLQNNLDKLWPNPCFLLWLNQTPCAVTTAAIRWFFWRHETRWRPVLLWHFVQLVLWCCSYRGFPQPTLSTPCDPGSQSGRAGSLSPNQSVQSWAFCCINIAGNYGENIFATSESSRERHFKTLLWFYLPTFGNWGQILITVAQLVTYGLLVTHMTMAEHERCST